MVNSWRYGRTEIMKSKYKLLPTRVLAIFGRDVPLWAFVTNHHLNILLFNFCNSISQTSPIPVRQTVKKLFSQKISSAEFYLKHVQA